LEAYSRWIKVIKLPYVQPYPYIYQSVYDILGYDCRYADRLPIGLEKIIRQVSPETVKAFFSRWYRPELMAVVIVGDFTDAGENS
jgi:predicted Zn-dependent peptidase